MRRAQRRAWPGREERNIRFAARARWWRSMTSVGVGAAAFAAARRSRVDAVWMMGGPQGTPRRTLNELAASSGGREIVRE